MRQFMMTVMALTTFGAMVVTAQAATPISSHLGARCAGSECGPLDMHWDGIGMPVKQTV
jgi:hypothetical protein